MSESMRDVAPHGARRPPRWNVVSLLAPVAGFLGAFLLVSVEVNRQNFDARRGWAVGTLYGVAVLGWACGFIAIRRAERPWGVTVSGFVLNAVLFLLAMLFSI